MDYSVIPIDLEGLSFGFFYSPVFISGIITPVLAAAPIFAASSFRQVDGIIETPAITTGPPTPFVQVIIFRGKLVDNHF